MKILVLGGGGFIGSAIVERLLADGHQLRIFERPRVPPYRAFAAHEAVQWLGADLSSQQDVSQAVAGMDAVLHLVSTTLPKNSNDDPIYDVQTNVLPSLQVLNAMVTHGVKKIVFISSGGTVYGTPQYTPIDEAHPTEPIVSYGVTKLAVEKYLHIYRRQHGLQGITLRVSNPYGERQRVETAQGAVGVFLHRALRQQAIEIWGDGSVVRDYVYVGDVADAFARALHYQGPVGVFNIGSGQGTSLNQLLQLLEQTLDRPIARQYLPGRSFDVPASVLNPGLAERELGWQARTPMAEGLARTAHWMAQQLAP